MTGRDHPPARTAGAPPATAGGGPAPAARGRAAPSRPSAGERSDDEVAVRAAVVRLGRRVVAAGLVVAAGGNVAARLAGDRVVVTPTAAALDELAPDDLAVVSLADGVPSGRGGPRPSTELAVHLAVLQARPDVGVSLHLHPPTATLLHALGIPIRTLTTDHVHALRRLASVPYLHPGTVELAHAVGAAATGADVVLLAHHGSVVLGDDADEAFSRAANLEAAAVATYRARLLGDTTTSCPPSYARLLADQEAHGIRSGR